MPSKVLSPSLQIPIEPLSASAFAPYGVVIQNPAHGPSAPSSLQAITANQGSATKYLDVTHLTDFYHLAPSRKPARAVMNMFVCAPRPLRSSSSSTPRQQQLFDVKILERHPFTSQTFIPLNLAANDPTTRYLVIVAPTLPKARSSSSSSKSSSRKRPPPFPEPEPRRKRSLADLFSRARPSPFDNLPGPPSSRARAGVARHPHDTPKGVGLPDLTRAKAFLADGSQAVTYAAGTWHAPMVVVGRRDVDFVVVQFANGVDLEDCQEVVLETGELGGDGLVVGIDASKLEDGGTGTPRSKL